MIEIAFCKDSVARQLINESNRIEMQINHKKVSENVILALLCKE
jgi:hypothetical protein